MKGLNGVLAATATPIREDLSIDLPLLVEHCRWLLGEGGCDGINLLGTTGEAASFSVAQRIDTMRAISDAQLPLDRFMVGTGAAAFEDTCLLTEAATSLGYSGALIVPPYYYKGITDSGLLAYIENVIARVRASKPSIYLYNIPANSGVPYSIEVVTKLRERFPNIIAGLKDSSNDIAYSSALAKTLPGFAVFPSSEGLLLSAHDHGFAGCISATTNVTGPLAQKVWSSTDVTERRVASGLASETRSLLASLPLVASVKAAISWRTGNPTWSKVVPPLQPLAPSDLRRLIEGLQAQEAKAVE